MMARIEWLDASGGAMKHPIERSWLAIRGMTKERRIGIRNLGRPLIGLELYAEENGVTTVYFKRAGKARRYVRGPLRLGDLRHGESRMFLVRETATGIEGPASSISVRET